MYTNSLTLGSLFDGIGGFPYAASFYGVRSLWASEVAPECVSVTRRHFPDMAHMGDITRLHGGQLPPVDIVTFGFPCQGHSLAGQRRGLADERSGLFMEAIRIIDEMREKTYGKYPQFAILENVPGVLSSSGGRDFKAVLEAFTKAEVPMPRSGRWANAGMVRGRGVDLAWCIYDSRHFGTAQRRRRLFLVCDFRGECAGEILFVPKSLRGYFEAGGTPRQGLAAFAESGVDTADPAVEILNDPAGFALRQITSKANRAGTFCMATGQSHAEILDDMSPTLNCNCEQPILIHPQIAGTLCASGAGLSRPAGMKSELDLCITSAGFRYKASSAAGSTGYQEETAPTLMAEQPSGVLKAVAVGANVLDWEFVVRRLTPLEAERLMGFEDHWTAHGHDGRPISDTKRYSMLGNSIAVPCVAYIIQGIRDVMLREGG